MRNRRRAWLHARVCVAVILELSSSDGAEWLECTCPRLVSAARSVERGDFLVQLGTMAHFSADTSLKCR